MNTCSIEHPFDPMIHCLFRDKPISDLSRSELIDALVQALYQVNKLDKIAYDACRRDLVSPVTW